MKILGIIPARYQSSRFPGKPLMMIGDKSMIERVYGQVLKTNCINDVVVATDDIRIYNHVLTFGGQVQMTRVDHESGTSRCVEIAEELNEYDIYVNIQGDEPFIQPTQIEKLVGVFIENEHSEIATLTKKINDYDSLSNDNIVKVVISQNKKALYFSRSPIPFIRDIPFRSWLKEGVFYKHVGMYGFRREVLINLKSVNKGIYHKLEKLEQLQWLENGWSIYVAETEDESIGIDTPEDLEKAIKLLG